MARTKQTAPKSTGGKPPPGRREPMSAMFYDHIGQPYTVEGGVVHNLNKDLVIQKLSIHLYTLSECIPSLSEIAHGLLRSGGFEDIQWQKERIPRIDVYPSPMGSIDECIEHHRREKTYRQKAVKDMRQRAADAVPIEPDDEPEDIQEKRYEAVRKLRGKEPLPHIVPAWCETSKHILDLDPYDTPRYRSFILIVPKDCTSYDAITSKGLWFVRFDQDISPDMDLDLWDMDIDEDQIVDTKHEWVYVETLPDGHLGPPLDIKRACVHRVAQPVLTVTNENTGRPEPKWWVTEGCNANLGRMIAQMMSRVGDGAYSMPVCDACYEGKRNHECEVELDERYFDEDGNYATDTIHKARRRQSKRLAKRRRLQE